MKPLKNRKKISSLYNEVVDNKDKLKEKKIEYTPQKAYPTKYSYPSIIYESDWLKPYFSNIGNIVTNEEYNLTKSNPTALKSQKVPVKLNFDTSVVLDIPESWLPHIRVSFLVKDYPNVEPIGVSTYNEWEYSSTNYYEIYGDSTLIYKGLQPSYKYFPESDITNGNILSSLTSKWFEDSIFYTLDGDNYEFRAENSFAYSLKKATIFYNVEAPPGPPVSSGIYNYEYFSCEAIDSLTSGSITGTGTYGRTWWTWEPGAIPVPQWVVHNESEKNVTKTIPFTGSYQLGIEATGRLYKEGVYQGFKSSWTVYDDTTPVDWWGHEDSVFTSFTPTHKQRLSENVYKLFYDDKRANEFDFSTSSFYIENVPTITDYETETLPYAKIIVDVNNTDEYPQTSQENDTTVNQSSTFIGWGKITDNQYKIILSGVLGFLIPATAEDTPYDADFVNEDWDSNGTTFVRVPATRGKEEPRYMPTPDLMLDFKFILSLDNNFEYRELKDYE